MHINYSLYQCISNRSGNLKYWKTHINLENLVSQCVSNTSGNPK